MKQGLTFVKRVALGDALESVPNRDVGIRRFVDGKVTFEHAALDTEFLYAKIEIRRHRVCQLNRIRLDRALMPVIAATRGANAA